MTALMAAALWFVVVIVRAALPSKDHHWRFAYVMIAIGFPILLWVWWAQGWVAALVVFAGALSVLRWPVIYLWRWVRGLM